MMCGIVASRPVAALWMQSASWAFIDAVEAIGGADAGADGVLASLIDLPDDVGVRDMGAGHADHVEAAFGDRVAGGRDIGDAGGVEDGHPRLGPDLAREIQARRGPHPHDGNHIQERGVGVDMAADDVEEVDEGRSP